MKFKIHNILLDNGDQTLPGILPVSDWEQCRLFVEILNETFQGEDKSQIRIADLGCLEGGHSVALARQGYQVVGIEAKPQNVEKCFYVKSNVKLPNLTFVQGDARNFPTHGGFDAVLCAGLLYHFDKPRAFIESAGRHVRRLLIVNTHYAPSRPENLSYGFRMHLYRFWQSRRNALEVVLPKHFRQWIDFRTSLFVTGKYRLSKIRRNEGLLGRWYTEHAPGASENEKNRDLLASFDNERSFWLLKEEIIKCLHDNGFQRVREEKGNYRESYFETQSRSTFVGCIHGNEDI